MVNFWGWWVQSQYIRYTMIYGPTLKKVALKEEEKNIQTKVHVKLSKKFKILVYF